MQKEVNIKQRQFKVLYILSSSSPFGGSSKSFLTTCLNLKNNFNVVPCVILPTANGIYHDLINNGIEVHIIKSRHNIFPATKKLKDYFLFPVKFLSYKLINFIATNSLAKITKTFRPDIIHTNVGLLNIGYIVANKLKIPHIYHLREFQDLDLNEFIFPSKKSFIRSLKRPINYSICITKGIQQYFTLDNTNSKVVYNGVKDIISDSDFTYDKTKLPYFLYVGRLNENKGIYEVLDAFIRLKNRYSSNLSQSYDLYIAGQGTVEDDKNIDKFLSNIDTDRFGIKFLGHRTDVPLLMQKAKAYIMPSKFEAFGRVTAEAMINGTIVIGRDTAGTKEQFDNGRKLTGHEIGLRYNDIDGLVERMFEVINLDERTYHEYVINSQKTVSQLYSTETNAKSIYSIYTNILGGN